MHVVQYCLAYMNKNKGFYANHHLGGIAWYNNTGYQNPSNFCMLNRKTASEAVDVPGYGHIIKNNLSHKPRSSEKHIIDVNQVECEIANNSFLPIEMTVTDDDFISLDAGQLTLSRKADGSLPEIDFLRLKSDSKLSNAGLGCFIGKGNEDTFPALSPIRKNKIISHVLIKNGIRLIIKCIDYENKNVYMHFS